MLAGFAEPHDEVVLGGAGAYAALEDRRDGHCLLDGQRERVGSSSDCFAVNYPVLQPVALVGGGNDFQHGPRWVDARSVAADGAEALGFGSQPALLACEVGHDRSLGSNLGLIDIVGRDNLVADGPVHELVARLGNGGQADDAAVQLLVAAATEGSCHAGTRRSINHLAQDSTGQFGPGGGDVLHQSSTEQHPVGLLAGVAVVAFEVGDGGGLNGQHVVAVGQLLVQRREVECPVGVVGRSKLYAAQILLLALHGKGNVLGSESFGLHRLVEPHVHLIDVLHAYGIVGMLHAGDAADLEFHVATVFECQEEHLSVEECALGHIGHIVQAALVEPVLAVDQRTVGLPDVIDGQFGTVALAHHLDELAPAGGVEHRAVVPSGL